MTEIKFSLENISGGRTLSLQKCTNPESVHENTYFSVTLTYKGIDQCDILEYSCSVKKTTNIWKLVLSGLWMLV